VTPSVLLALEFSTDRRSVAVVSGGMVLAERGQETGRSTRVFSLIADVLKAAGKVPGDLDALAVGLGPGSYTGIRLAISVAQGWRLATEGPGTRPGPLRVIAPSSFAVLAASLDGSGWLAADAQKEEWAIASLANGMVTSAARLISGAELRGLATRVRVVGPEVVTRLGIGEAAFPSAGQLGLIAEKSSEPVAAESLAPVYLRAAAFVKASPPRVIPGFTPD